MRSPVIAIVVLIGCTSRGPIPMTQRELKARGTHTFDAPFDEVYDAAYLSLARYEGRIATASRLEGVLENEKAEFSAPAGWDGTAYRNYSVSVFQEGARVSVTAVPRLWANDRDVSDEPLWVLPGNGGEEEHWERYFSGIEDLILAWRDVPDLELDKSTGVVKVLGIRFSAPADWRGLELSVDRKSAVSQSQLQGNRGCPECPGGLNPSIVFEVARRQPPPDAAHLEVTALEHALGPRLATPEAWDTHETPTGRHGAGQVVAGDPAKTVSVTWKVWDANEPTWMIRAAAACGPPASPSGCEAQWDSMINGVSTTPQ